MTVTRGSPTNLGRFHRKVTAPRPRSVGGSRRSSDTTDLLRFGQSNLGEKDVEWWGAVDGDFKVVVVDGDVFDEFVEEGSSFGFGGFVPDGVEVEGGEQLGDFLEPFGDVVVALDVGLVLVGFGAQGVDEGGEAGFFFAEQFG